MGIQFHLNQGKERRKKTERRVCALTQLSGREADEFVCKNTKVAQVA